MIKALIVEKSAEHSYFQAGKITAGMIGKRFKSLSETVLANISRQTVYNIIKNSDMEYVYEPETKDDIDTLYIQFDEKYVHTQGNDGKSKEIKAAVIYTDIEEEYHNRKRLVNRHVITSSGSASLLKRKCLDYIYKTYDSANINQIIISGDGASWIKKSNNDFKFHSKSYVINVLDRFHMNQAVNHITKNDDFKYYLRNYIYHNSRVNFKKLCDSLIESDPDRVDVITKNKDYIISNWNNIQNQKYPLFKGCSMEGHISHVLASLFTARPKAHSLHMINKRLRHENFISIKKTLNQYTYLITLILLHLILPLLFYQILIQSLMLLVIK